MPPLRRVPGAHGSGASPNIIWCIGGDWHPGRGAAGPRRDRRRASASPGGDQPVHRPRAGRRPRRSRSSPAPTGSTSTSTYTYDIVHRALLADWQREPVVAVLPDRVHLRGRAQRVGPSDPPPGVVVGALRAATATAWATTRSGCSGTAGRRPRPARLRGDGSLGRVLPRAALGRSRARPEPPPRHRGPGRGAGSRPRDGGADAR